MARSRRRPQPEPRGRGPELVVWLFVALAGVGVLARLIAAFTYGGLTAGAAIGAGIGAIAVAVQALVPAVAIGRARGDRARPVVAVVGLGLIGVAQVASAVAAATLAVAFRSGRTPSSIVYPIALVIEPAFAITAAVGTIVVLIGLAGAAGPRPRRFRPALAGLSIGLWFLLAITFVAQYVLGYTLTPPILFGMVGVAAVAAAGWIGSAAIAWRRRLDAPRSLRPLTGGALLIGLATLAEVAIVQLIASDPVRARDVSLAVVRAVVGWVGIGGWLLVLVAAWRGLPGAAPDPEPARPATMKHP